MTTSERLVKYGLRSIAIGYLAAILVIPLGIMFWKTFGEGLAGPIETVTSEEGLHAFWMTMLCAGIAVPLNTIFGVAAALVLVRQKMRGKAFLNVLIDLPFAVSPVVIGLSLLLVYGEQGWFGGALSDVGIKIIFSTPGLVLATIFVSLPFVVREVQPVLQEIGTDQEEASSTLGATSWQTFWRITLPSIRWGLTYGVVLATARALGEYGAVAVVSGKISGQTETLPLLVENEYANFNTEGAYAAAIVLALIAITVLVAMNLIRRRSEQAGEPEPNIEPDPGMVRGRD
ncbi:MAG: sulfate ABC transporter permease subunit CysW [Solirubrobacterales bacterium]